MSTEQRLTGPNTLFGPVILIVGTITVIGYNI